YYTVVTFKAEASFPAELERLFNIDETIMRSIVLRLECEATAKPVVAEPVAEEVVAEEVPAETEAPADAE
ncbi:MAG: 30S ribosomal protein S6, partial [Clostridia bacterium]|nr:30S ribosomal protein S6 [Clostridia bacterium]